MTPPTTGTITLYWRPGCLFCSMLDRKLRKLGVPAERINIWEDPEAAATVRGITGGHETVPTVVVGDVAMVNPRAADVIEVFGRLAS